MRQLRGLALCGLLAGCGNAPATSDAGMDAAVPDLGPSPVDRGRYIMNNVALCTFCHTPLNPDGTRDMTRLFAGWDCFVDVDPDPNLGCLSSANLTPDNATGLGMWTDAQIMNAFRNGMDNMGKPLAFVMPYWVFHNMTDDDAKAIVAYLRTLPAVSHKVTEKQPPWSLAPAPATPIAEAMIPMPKAGTPDMASAMRGRYLTSHIGLCIDCHTKDTFMNPTPIDVTNLFAGGRLFTAPQLGLPSMCTGEDGGMGDAALMCQPYPMNILTANITSDMATGIGGWTAAQLVMAFKQGADRMNHSICAATHGSSTSSYSGLTDQDAMDIANYLLSIPGINNPIQLCQGPHI
jgi:hypothetical protein